MVGVTQARKERQKAERESLILDHATRLLLRDGFQDLNLDELARAVEYSKGTIYLHFASKEDLVLAVANRALAQRVDLFEKALKFQGTTRERIRAIGFASIHFSILNSDYFHIEMTLKSDSFWEKASVQRQEQHEILATRCCHSVNNIVLDALRSGDLPSSVRAQDVTFGLIAVSMGSHMAAGECGIRTFCGIEDPIQSTRLNQDIVCDGFGWRPLSTEFDAVATDKRIRAEIFPDANWFRPPLLSPAAV
jgi:AcrR family transcriptional regulator